MLLSIQSNLIPISLNWAGPLREAFLRAGVDCLFYPQGIHPTTEATLIDIVRPDCVFSINQFRSDVLAERRNIKHVLWLQDDQVFGFDYARSKPTHQSDIVYFMDENLRKWLSQITAPLCDILMFAADVNRCEEHTIPTKSDFSFVGYIPSREWLTQDFDLGNGTHIKLIDLFSDVAAATGRSLAKHPGQMKPVLEKFLKRRRIGVVPPDKASFIQENVLRAFYRWANILLATQISNSIRLYGPSNWRSWPEFSNYYLGELWALDGLVELFRSTKINLHNGGSILHPRVFECLGAGAFLMTNRVRGESRDALFVDGEHLVRYDSDSFAETARRYLMDDAARTKIARNAVNFVRGAHTWDHRVAQVLRQVDSL